MMLRTTHTLFYLLCTLLQSVAQPPVVRIKESLAWDELLTRAKTANKYIILDFYATWCKPCFEMDRQVFADSTTKAILNKYFIIRKIQADSTNKDNAETRQWQYVAAKLMDPYKIAGFPTFLVLDPEGKVVQKIVGAMNKMAFLEAALNATNQERQFYTNVTRGALPHHSRQKLLALATEATNLGHEEVRDSIYRFYMEKYLASCSIPALAADSLLPRILDEMAHLIRQHDPFFACLYKHRTEIDRLKQDSGYTADLLAGIIASNHPKLTTTGNIPNWTGIQKKITAQFDPQLSEKVVNNLKLSWYQRQKKMDSAAHYLVKLTDSNRIQASPPTLGTLVTLNNNAYFVFQHSTIRNDLVQALNWAEIALRTSVQLEGQPSAGILDTKANLLFKLGEVNEAKKILKQAIQLEPDFDELKVNLDKMEKGQPTWKKE